MCGASSEQKQTYAEQNAFYGQLTSEYATVFGEDQSILNEMTAIYKPILEAGPNQKGFSSEEETALRTQATEGTAQNYQKAAVALSESLNARGGGDTYIPSAADEEIKAELASSAAGQESREQLGITEENYAQGRAQFNAASSVLATEAGLLNPTGFAGATTGAGSAAAQTANEITQANNSWIAPVLGAVGGVLGQAAGNESGFFGCWIAEAIYGVDDSRTHQLRYWLNFVWAKESIIGRYTMKLYRLVGRQVAAVVKRNSFVRGCFKPIFDFALSCASKVR